MWMACHVMSCHVRSCHVMSCHVMSCHVMSCHVMSCHSMRPVRGLLSMECQFYNFNYKLNLLLSYNKCILLAHNARDWKRDTLMTIRDADCCYYLLDGLLVISDPHCTSLKLFNANRFYWLKSVSSNSTLAVHSGFDLLRFLQVVG